MEVRVFEIIKAALFGIVEGITEWLPVSSTGHMLLLNEFVSLDATPEFYSVFEVVIQLGAILAAIILLWKKIWPFRIVERKHKRHIASRVKVWRMWLNVAITCVPAIIVGLLFDDYFDALFSHPVWTAIWLIVFGAMFLVVEGMREGRHPAIKSMYRITPAQATIIGLSQVVAAILPGASRSGMTILCALLLGISRGAATEYTFTVAIPVMAGASLLKLVKHGFVFSQSELILLGTGMLVAFIVSLIVIRGVLRFIRSHNFRPFGWYRIAIGTLALIYFMIVKG